MICGRTLDVTCEPSGGFQDDEEIIDGTGEPAYGLLLVCQGNHKIKTALESRQRSR